MKTDTDLNKRYLFAQEIAIKAGELTLRYFHNPDVAVELKGDDSPVTQADREAEAFLREQISTAFPEDGIIGEEYGESNGSSPYRWILDPIDGTRAFVCGVPLYGTLIGLQRDCQSVAGLIEIPVLGERMHACIGGGAWYQRDNGKPERASVSKCTTLADAIFLSSEFGLFRKLGAPKALEALEDKCLVGRTWGDCYGYMMVATGRADIMVDPLMNIWDAAAILPIMVEAGGCFTDWKGEASVSSGEGLACNKDLLPLLLPLLVREN